MEHSPIYTVVKKDLAINGETWTLIGADEYLGYIQNNHKTGSLNSLTQYALGHQGRAEFKWNTQIGTLQFLLVIYPGDKKILVASKQLSYELTILPLIDGSDIPAAKDLKDHIKTISEVPVENSPTIIEELSAGAKLPLFNEEKFQQIHQNSDELTDKLIGKVNEYSQTLFERFSDFGLDLTANFMLIRIHLLKFLAILPNLDHDKEGREVKRIFLETLRRLISDSKLAASKSLKGQKRPLPNLYIQTCNILMRVSELVPAKILAFTLRYSVGLMAKRFIAGESIAKAQKSLLELIESGRDATIDQLGELVVSKKEADEYTDKVLEIVYGMKGHISKGAKNAAGINKAHVSIKVSALCHDFKPHDFDYTYNQIAPRLKKILTAGMNEEVFINVDAEHYHFRDIIFDIYKKVLLDSPEYKDYAETGIVVQAYLRDGYKHLDEVIDLAKARKIVMPIRLVKGAYWDAETIEADAHNFDAPQFLNKEETDIHFRQLCYKALEAKDAIQLAVASHNIKDHCFAEALREDLFKDSPVIEHQCLHMTYEALSVGLAKMGWPTRNYIPVGDLLVGMAYLVRRIMENSSQVGVLTIMRSHKKGMDMKTPTEILRKKKDKNKIEFDISIRSMTKEFKNIYPIRSYLKEQFQRVDAELQKDLKAISNNDYFFSASEKGVDVLCSSDPSLKLGEIAIDDAKEVKKKIEKLFSGFQANTWSAPNSIHRFGSLLKFADLMLIERERLTSLIMLEAGKTIDEAIADVDEAIDFVNFYVREQIKIESEKIYAAKGAIGVIAPWNFPLAIPCGMTVAALVAGNTVILKPAEQTPLIAKAMIELAYKAGIPETVLQVSFGEAEVGKAIVDHELINGVVFTGSKAVGESIYRKLSGQMTSIRYGFKPIPKFAITEMGGKNAIIVTNNSELDETVSGVIYSAFAHAGQKCSAASRVIIDHEIKDAFLNRFAHAVEDINIGKSYDYSTVVNPLVSREDELRVKAMASKSREEVEKFGGRVIVDKSKEDFPGYCVGPSIFELSAETVLNNKTMASEEVFGPLVHIIPYKGLDQALNIFNSTEYALTGGVFCQSQDDIDYLLPKMKAGNLYINRPNTGARVAIEPFGGFKMSGTGPKAGGVDYLYQFNRLLENKTYTAINVYDLDNLEEKNQLIVRNSKLSFARRTYNLKQMLKKLTNQFEVYLSAINETDKEKIFELWKMLGDSSFNLETREYPNRYIPGQISFNRRNMAKGRGVLLAGEETVDGQLFIDFLINLIVGNGVTIITTNKASFENWNKICELAFNNGFSPYNLSVSLLEKDSLLKALEELDYEFLFTGGNKLDDDVKQAVLKNEAGDRLIKIIYSGFHNTWDDGIDSFTHCRAFAINTMRHGAPLDLTL